MIGHYKRSKYLAERKAVELAAKGAEVVIVNPSTPVGEQDIKPTPTGRIVLDFLLGNFPAYMETGMNLVDVHDVARGHLLAFEKGRRGERYILGGENLTLKQILDILGELTGLAFAHDEGSTFGGNGLCGLRSDLQRILEESRAKSNNRRGSHGQEVYVGGLRQSRA